MAERGKPRAIDSPEDFEALAFEYIESFTPDVGYAVTITGVLGTDLEVNALRQLLSSNGYKDFQLTTTGK